MTRTASILTLAAFAALTGNATRNAMGSATRHSTGSVLQARFDGVFRRDSAAGDNLERVVADAVPKVKNGLARIFKGRAKSRLRQVVTAAAWQKFTNVGDSIRLETSAFTGARALVTPVTGAKVRWKRYWTNGKSETLDVETPEEDGARTYRYIAEDGERTDVYRLDAAGTTLTQDVTLTSSQLSAPIRYKLVYRRERSTP